MLYVRAHRNRFREGIYHCIYGWENDDDVVIVVIDVCRCVRWNVHNTSVVRRNCSFAFRNLATLNWFHVVLCTFGICTRKHHQIRFVSMVHSFRVCFLVAIKPPHDISNRIVVGIVCVCVCVTLCTLSSSSRYSNTKPSPLKLELNGKYVARNYYLPPRRRGRK